LSSPSLGRLFLQLAFVASRDADVLEDHYAWPPGPPLSYEERHELARLRTIAARWFYLAAEQGWIGGTDEAFAYLPKRYRPRPQENVHG